MEEAKPQRTRNIILIALVLAIAFAAYVASMRSPAAPQVELTTIRGERIAMADLRGRVVLVNFWATDCPACVKEMPAMVETWRKFHERGFEALFIAMKHDRPDFVVNFTEKNRLPFKVALDLKGELAQAFGDVKLTPTTLVIDKRGNIVFRVLGEPDFARLHALLDEKLRDPA